MITTLDKACDRWGMCSNGEKTKVFAVGETLAEDESPIKLRGHTLGKVKSSYPGSEMGQTTKAEREGMVRLKKTGMAYQVWRWKAFRSCNLNKATKLRAFCVLVMSILLYGAGTLLETQQDIMKLRTFHIRRL